MKKRVISIFVIVCMIFTVFPVTGQADAATVTTPYKVGDATVNERIEELKTLVNMGFTTNGTACYAVASHRTDYCWKCDVTNVLSQNSTVRALIKKHKGAYNMSSYSNMPKHHYNGSNWNLGDSCCGFTSFAGWYLFSDKYTDKVTTNVIRSKIKYNYSNMKTHIKPGDMLRFDGAHSAVAISVNGSGVKVIQSNWTSQPCKVSVNTIPWSRYDYVGISRATNYTTSPLSKPTGLGASNVESTGNVKLTWNAVSGANKYEIYRASSRNGAYVKMCTTTSTYYVNTIGERGHLYYYKVKAVSTTNNKASNFSAVVSRTRDLARPTGVKATTSAGKPKVTWNAVSDADRYEVWRKTGTNGAYSKVATVSGARYTNTSAVKGKTYYYKIKAICDDNSGGNSAFSAQVGIKATK